MHLENIESFQVTGRMITTCNADELQPDKAQIGGLWQGFYAEVAPKTAVDSKFYGVYTNYESDHNGLYDLWAATDGKLTDIEGNLEVFTVPAGKYLVFSAAGSMPQTVIELWQEIWSFFGQTTVEYKRIFKTDFEYYKGNEEVDIYISVE
ncbi:GyrI-like domain-containing protein [Vibrio sp.]|nr:GyrI-like domain-containing protein [Vibrio sp.]